MKFQFDPTINLGHVLSATVVVLSLVGAYYDLKGDVRHIDDKVEFQGQQQKIIDGNQDRRLDEIKTTVETSTTEIKQELRRITVQVPRNEARPTTGRPAWESPDRR